MRKTLTTLAGAMLLPAAAVAATPVDREAELARALEGRVAGAPVECIPLHRTQSWTVIPGTAILYDVAGTVYVNRPRAGAEELNRWDTLVTRTPIQRLCSADAVEVVDLRSGVLTGLVYLGEFVPYRRTGN